MIEGLWIYKGACLVVCVFTAYHDNLSSIGWLLIFLASTLVARVVYRRKYFELRIIAPLDFFAVLMAGYLFPHSLLLEYLLLPTILLEIPLFFPPIPAFLIAFLLGIPGSIFLSYSFYQSITINIQGVAYTLSLISCIYYIPITLASLMLAIQFAHIDRNDAYLSSLKTLNSQLDKINKNITRKMFHLKRDLATEERKKISKEIHDAAGYIFVNLISMLQTASVLFYKNSQKAESLVNDAREYSSRGINEIRHILQQVRDSLPSPQSLQHELFDIGQSFSKATDVQVSIEFGNWPASFCPRLDMFFTSFMQEALTNALKHGAATAIEARCWISSGEIGLSIADNGKGATEPIQRGIGITSIEEFVRPLDGAIRIQNDSIGFTITVLVPESALGELTAEAETR